MSSSQSGKGKEGKEKKKKAEKQTENMHNEEEDEQVLRAITAVASNADQPRWVSELQASFHTGMDKIHAKIVDMRAQKKEIDILEERTVEVEEWTTEVQDILTASLRQQAKLQEKLS